MLMLMLMPLLPLTLPLLRHAIAVRYFITPRFATSPERQRLPITPLRHAGYAATCCHYTELLPHSYADTLVTSLIARQ